MQVGIASEPGRAWRTAQRPGARVQTAALALMLVLAPGCARLAPEPDLTRLYSGLATRERPPLIVVPGVMGSRLVDAAGHEIWPGSFFDLLSGRHFSELALPEPGTTEYEAERTVLRPAGLFYEAAGRDFYGNLLATLTGPGGYHCVPASEVDAETDCVLFAWDWRKDLVEAAGHLDALIERIRQTRGNPTLRVDIVAHSAGGLVTRYFARFGARDVLDRATEQVTIDGAGGAKIRKAILIGTPNYGSISALQRAIMGNRVGAASMKPELMASMPSLFELLPHPDRTWMIGLHGERLERNLYDIETWRHFRWSLFDPVVRQRIRDQFDDAESAVANLAAFEKAFERGLARAKRFQRALSIPLREAPNQYIVFGGDCQLTPARCLLEKVGGQTKVRLHPDQIVGRIKGIDYARLMLEPGDGRVTKASLLARDTLDPKADTPGFFPIDYVVLLCRKHEHLPSDVTFRDNLLNILLY